MSEKDEAVARWSAVGPRPGEVYRHYKGGLYTVMARAIHEETLEPLVIYQSNAKGSVWARTLGVFAGLAEVEADRDFVRRVPRFERVRD